MESLGVKDVFLQAAMLILHLLSTRHFPLGWLLCSIAKLGRANPTELRTRMACITLYYSKSRRDHVAMHISIAILLAI